MPSHPLSKDQPLPTRCPFCGNAVAVERVRCHGCGTAVEGAFNLGWVERLSPEQLAFARVFLECRGKIKDVEQALEISYPTVVSRLEDVVRALQTEPAASAAERAEKRRKVLEALASGEIDADEAAQRLKQS
jgi:hypothetical protein